MHGARHTSLGPAIKGSGKITTETRSLSDFERLSLSGSPDVNVTVGEAFKLTVATDDNLQKHLTTKVSGDTLEIHFDESNVNETSANITLEVPKFTSVIVTGSGDVVITGLKNSSFNAIVTGSGSVKASSGRVDNLEASVTGSGEINLSSLESKSAKASITGSGDIELNVTSSLDAHITGSGSIGYKGSPLVKEDVTGSGEVKKS